MAWKLSLLGVLLSLAGVWPASADLYLENDAAGPNSYPALRFGVGYTYSDDLNEMVEEDEDDDDCEDDGDWGWIELSLGVEAPLNLHIAMVPFVSLYLNNADDAVSSMLVPTMAMKFIWETDGSLTDFWYPYAEYFPYLQIEGNYNFPLGGDEADIDDGGFGGAVVVGWQIPYDFNVEVGASYIPVDVDDDCQNMGGFIARLVKVF